MSTISLFDRLPNTIVAEVFEKIDELKTWTSVCSVCRRFRVICFPYRETDVGSAEQHALMKSISVDELARAIFQNPRLFYSMPLPDDKRTNELILVNFLSAYPHAVYNTVQLYCQNPCYLDTVRTHDFLTRYPHAADALRVTGITTNGGLMLQTAALISAKIRNAVCEYERLGQKNFSSCDIKKVLDSPEVFFHEHCEQNTLLMRYIIRMGTGRLPFLREASLDDAYTACMALTKATKNFRLLSERLRTSLSISIFAMKQSLLEEKALPHSLGSETRTEKLYRQLNPVVQADETIKSIVKQSRPMYALVRQMKGLLCSIKKGVRDTCFCNMGDEE